MTISRIRSGGEFEAKIGYCRAVVANGFVHVAGTVGQGDTVEEQCRAALDIIGNALQTGRNRFRSYRAGHVYVARERRFSCVLAHSGGSVRCQSSGRHDDRMRPDRSEIPDRNRGHSGSAANELRPEHGLSALW